MDLVGWPIWKMRMFQSKQFQDDYLKSENLHLSLSLTFDISMTWFCVERWRLGVTDSETHRWMSIRTDPNNPFMAAAVAWNGKLHPWLNTDSQFREHCSWVEFLVPFVRDMLRAQHFFLMHSEIFWGSLEIGTYPLLRYAIIAIKKRWNSWIFLKLCSRWLNFAGIFHCVLVVWL